VQNVAVGTAVEKLPMVKEVIVLSSVLALLCVGGCIPIGVRGSTMAGADAAPRASQPALGAQEAAAAPRESTRS
jgi:hypothetical protein